MYLFHKKRFRVKGDFDFCLSEKPLDFLNNQGSPAFHTGGFSI